MAVWSGSSAPSSFRLGSSTVSALYLGSTQVWAPSGSTTPPTYGTQGVLAYGSRTNSAVPVPAGVAANSIILVDLYIEGSYVAVTPPSGFTEITFGTTPSTSASPFGVRKFWKRATAADSGTYTFTHASSLTEVLATRWDGCVTTGTPVEAPTAATRDSAGSVTPAVSLTTLGTNRTLVFWAQTYGSSGYTPPTGFTEVYDPADGLTLAYKTQAATGATGSVTASSAGSFPAQIATMLALIPA